MPSPLKLVKKKIICFLSSFLKYITSQPGPGTAREKFNELTLHKVFSLVTRLGFGVWGTLGSRGQGWRGHACVKSLPRVGGEVCAKFGGDWSGGSGVKRVHR